MSSAQAAPAKKPFDLEHLAQENTAVLKLRDPRNNNLLKHDDGSQVIITVASMDSEQFKAARRARLNERLTNRVVDSAEALDNDTADQLVWATVGWNLVLGGKPLEFSPDAARKLYNDSRFGWIGRQVDAFVADRANFIKAS